MSVQNPNKLRITSWSPSRLSTYLECPAKAFFKYIKKMSEPSSPALERGTELHEAIENYISWRTSKLHKEVKAVAPLLKTLRTEFKKKLIRTELELAFNRLWQPCHWLAPDVYCRFKLDLLRLSPADEACEVLDWKTGRFKENGHYDDALNGYATAILGSTYADKLKSATGKLVFTDEGQVVERPSGTLTRAQLPKAQKVWDGRVKKMLSDTAFKPCPSNACRWCPYSVQKNGPCDY